LRRVDQGDGMYVDTNVIIAFMDEKDPNHRRAIDLLSKSKDKTSSFLTLVELASVYSRADLENPQALAIYSMEEAGIELSEVDFSDVLKMALGITEKVRLRILDLLHIASCSLLGEKEFLTFDNEILKRRDMIKELDIEVIG